MDFLDTTSTQNSPPISLNANPFAVKGLDLTTDFLSSNFTGNGDLSYQTRDLAFLAQPNSKKLDDPDQQNYLLKPRNYVTNLGSSSPSAESNYPQTSADYSNSSTLGTTSQPDPLLGTQPTTGFSANNQPLTTQASQASIEAFQQNQDGLVIFEAEEYHNQETPGVHEWTLVSDNQASGGEAMQATPDQGTNNNSDYADSSPRLDYTIEFDQTGEHYVWVLGRAAGDKVGTSNSLHVGLDGQEVQTADRISSFEADFGWSNETMDGAPAILDIEATGVHTLNLWMREDGFVVDRVILSPDSDFDPMQGTGTPKAFEQDQNGLVSLEAEQYHEQVTAGVHEWTLVSDSQASGGKAMQATPDNGTNNDTDYSDNSPRLDYTVKFDQTGEYYVWVLGRAAGDTKGTSDSLHVGLDGQEVQTADRMDGFEVDFGWSNETRDGTPATLDVSSTGVHTLNLWMREDGFVVDQVILSTDPDFDPTNATPSGGNKSNSDTNSNGVQAKRANDFIDSLGINWGLREKDLIPLLQDLGIRNIRIEAKGRLIDTSPYGIKMLYLINPRDNQGKPDPSEIDEWLDAARPYKDDLIGIEGPNEYDYGDPDKWAPILRDFQKQLYQKVKADPDFANLPVLPPSPHTPYNLKYFGDMTQISDASNLHAYTGARHPGNDESNLAMWLDRTKQVSGDDPHWVTETGYNSGKTNGKAFLSEAGEAKYLPRLMMEYFDQGVSQIFDYRFTDGVNHGDNDWGMVDENGNPREQYWSLKHALDILDDKDATFTPGTLNYSLTGDKENVREVLLQKGDGTFYLIVWQEVNSFDKSKATAKNTYEPIDNPSVSLKLNLDSLMATVKTYLPLTSGTKATNSYTNMNSISLDVPDHLLIVELMPKK